jgi:hypothetical protein
MCTGIPLFPDTPSCLGASLSTENSTLNQAVYIALKGKLKYQLLSAA